MVMRLLIAGWLVCGLAAVGQATSRQRSASQRPIRARPVNRSPAPVDATKLMRNVRSTWYQAHDDMKITFRKEIMESAIERGRRPPPEIHGEVGLKLEVTAIVPTVGARQVTPILLHSDGSIEELPRVSATGIVTAFDLQARLGPGRSRLRFVHEGGSSELAINL